MQNKKILKEIKSFQNKKRAQNSLWFFKTGPGEYGEGDKFLGLTNPIMRAIAKKYPFLSKEDIQELLKSKWHEKRQIALFILSAQYKKADRKKKKEMVDFYLKNTEYINNWDLVDLSASYILGDYLLSQKNKKILLKLVRSKNLWEQRIAIISTFAFIYKGETAWTYRLAKILLKHKHDLIHKAVGWMLREAGKRVSEKELEIFLKKNFKQMPRTMLRYAIEKFPEKKRKYYLNLR